MLVVTRGPNAGLAVRCSTSRRRHGRPPPRQRHLPRRHHRVPPPRRGRARSTAATRSATSARSTAPTSTGSGSRRPPLTDGDELQIGKFKLALPTRASAVTAAMADRSPPVDRRGPRPAAGRVPRRHDLQDPVPREPGPARPRAHAVGLPEVLRGRHRPAALDPAPAARPLPAPEGHQGPPRGGGHRRPRGAARRAAGRRRRCRPPSLFEEDAPSAAPRRSRRAAGARASPALVEAPEPPPAEPAPPAAPSRAARPAPTMPALPVRPVGQPARRRAHRRELHRSRSWPTPAGSPSASSATSTRFGLLVGHSVAGDTFYDGDALDRRPHGRRLPALRHRGPPPAHVQGGRRARGRASWSRWSCRCSSSATPPPASRRPRTSASWPASASSCGPRCCASALRDHTDLR